MPIVTTSTSKRSRRNSSIVTLRPPLAIAAVVIAAAIAVYLGARAVRPRQAPPKVSDTADNPASTAGSPAAVAPSATTGGAASGRAEPERGETPRLPVAGPSTLQPSNSSTSALASAEAEAPEPPLPELPPTALKMAAEQLLALVISANDDIELPPPPMGDERTLRRDLMIALTNDIVIYDDEDPKSQRLKEDIAEAKLHLKQVIDEGGTITQAIEDYRAWKRENIRMRREVRSEYVRLRREATREEAEEYLREANKALEAEGVQPIEIGPPRRKKSVRNGDPRPPKPEHAQEQ